MCDSGSESDFAMATLTAASCHRGNDAFEGNGEKNLLQNQYCKSTILQLRNLNKSILNIHEQLICRAETTSPDRCVATLCCEAETGGPPAESGRGCTALRGETLTSAARDHGVQAHGPSVGDLLGGRGVSGLGFGRWSVTGWPRERMLQGAQARLKLKRLPLGQKPCQSICTN